MPLEKPGGTKSRGGTPDAGANTRLLAAPATVVGYHPHMHTGITDGAVAPSSTEHGFTPDTTLLDNTEGSLAKPSTLAE